MVKLFLIRHGESEKADPEPVLTVKGKQQSKYLAKSLAQLKITKVYVSSSQRTIETYKYYKVLKPKVPSKISEQLKEIYRVIVGGPKRIGTPLNREQNDKKRANKILKEIIRNAKENDAIAIFTHGNLIRYILAHFLNIKNITLWNQLEIHDASISLIEIIYKKPKVRLINSIEHLGKKEVEKFYNEYSESNYFS